MSKRVQVITKTYDQIHAENMALIAEMPVYQRLHHAKRLRANLAHLRRAQRRSLSGKVARKYVRRSGIAPASQMQPYFETHRKYLLEEIEACGGRP